MGVVRAFLLALGAWAVFQAGQDIAPRAHLTLRFHHLHYAVADPAIAIRRVVEATGGERVLLPGLGPGVRIGTEFVLFDRAVEAQATADTTDTVDARYRQAAMWLRRRGIQVVESATGGPKLAAKVGTDRLDHIGLVCDDFDAAVRAVEAAGAAPLRRSVDAAMFKVPDGARIEIVRHTEGP